jgi:hypothetical protein
MANEILVTLKDTIRKVRVASYPSGVRIGYDMQSEVRVCDWGIVKRSDEELAELVAFRAHQLAPPKRKVLH